ncbi:trypsin-like peptidase domain-containing protein [Natronomonas salina]|uniref:S1C family serine protease n=1 Tax=Natronomonas salina TaxID=1710540 RepID=UPI0015B6707A|nr:trypsin-like peptidase domain-containing protein [Natronomonas salina]QLD90245.1 trypsin-like peptidase domain-containing protein [Natronomonas salina]
MEDPTRRRFLAAATGLAAGLAGCPTGFQESAEPVSRSSAPANRTGRYTEVYEGTVGSVTYVGDARGGGSGFVYEDYVVTNQHVVADADSLDVRFADGEWREAAVNASDVYADLAVLATDVPDDAPPLSFVDSVPPVGTEVLALGSPFGLESSVSTGIISGKNRSLPGPTGYSIPNTVQTDAGLDPGNSGGPLVTMDGEVTGIAVAGAGTSVGFAVSPLLAQRVLPELIQTGSYDHPYLGISLLPVTPTLAEANDLEAARGIFVLELRDDGPEGQTLRGADGETVVDGQRVPTGGDVLVELAGNRIDSNADLGTTLALELSPGQRVDAVVIRDGERQEVTVPIGARPDPEA